VGIISLTEQFSKSTKANVDPKRASEKRQGTFIAAFNHPLERRSGFHDQFKAGLDWCPLALNNMY
jgi:hypothetical protein